jgi:hypothetical protein
MHARLSLANRDILYLRAECASGQMDDSEQTDARVLPLATLPPPRRRRSLHPSKFSTYLLLLRNYSIRESLCSPSPFRSRLVSSGFYFFSVALCPGPCIVKVTSRLTAGKVALTVTETVIGADVTANPNLQ